MVAVDNAAKLTQYIDEQNIVLSKLSQLFEDDKSTKVSLSVILYSTPPYKFSNLKVKEIKVFIFVLITLVILFSSQKLNPTMKLNFG